MLLFLSFYFTQICAFIAYSFRFISYYSCFYRCKSTHFFKGARIWVCFFQMERKTICNSALIRHRNQRHIQHDRNPCIGGWREVVATYSLVVIYTIPFVAQAYIILTSVVRLRTPPQRRLGVLIRISQSTTKMFPSFERITFSSWRSLK